MIYEVIEPYSHNFVFSLWTDQLTTIAYGTYDTQSHIGSELDPRFFALFSYTTGAANNLTFTPPGQVDTVIVYMQQNGGTATATYNVDGGASLGTITNAGANALFAYTATVTKGAHTINIVPNNNGLFNIAGIIAYDSTTPAIDVIQDGQYGSVAASWNSAGNPCLRGAFLEF